MSFPFRSRVVAGAVAGVIGTAGYTALSSTLKRRGVGVDADAQPGEVAATLAGAPRTRLLNAGLHWGYGAFGGVTRTGLVRMGLSGWRLELAHFAAIWLPWRALLLLSGKGKPQSGGALLVDCGKHLVYVLGTGATLRAISGRGQES